jgi:hypothetical protein
MEIHCRRSWKGVHEYFCLEEYDARASSSMFDEASGGQLNIKHACSKCLGSQESMSFTFLRLESSYDIARDCNYLNKL